ncbi:rabGTPase-activating protein [Trypanosoma rangeli]|uniref:RabGTPase-activating protein n=1 Tax=Trypanosoma rangeli TaxID=5698 RepID=A0A422NPV9_TRYRA|nr:rabGTPase-activating protein [Trypanosoma rangeli]RNF07540.1 rabGTPase-activating protein [Trypanosoma rangeli]|eukprot:RNF07540.1 rabGTPase-activating protein [Trypanosoma rangeli]
MTDLLRVTVECWENQRYHPMKGWGFHRLPMDRSTWSNKKGDTVLCRDSFLTPIGWVWLSEWEVAPNGNERDGWFYAADFSISTRFCSATPSAMSYVRRRRWVRTRVQLTADLGVDSVLLNALSLSSYFRADPRIVWLSTSFYGFFGASVKEQRENQDRQHVSCYHLQQFIDASSHAESANDGDACVVGNGCGVSSYTRHPSITKAMLRCVYRYGLPQCLRSSLWLKWSGGSNLLRESPRLYDELIERVDRVERQPLQDILQDVMRTSPRHPFFAKKGGGAEELRNVLLALELACALPSYHQAFSYIVATVLLNLPAREAFWVVTALFTAFLPPGYHEKYTLQYDLQLYDKILAQRFPDLHAHFVSKRIDVSVFASGWLQGVFCAHFPFCTAARVLDVIFAEGNSSTLVRFLVAFTGKFRSELLRMDSSGSVGYFANEWARNCFSVEDLVHAMEKDGLTPFVLSHREATGRAAAAAAA